MPIRITGTSHSVDYCNVECTTRGFKYSARQYDGECYCGNSGYDKHGGSNLCGGCNSANIGGYLSCVYEYSSQGPIPTASPTESPVQDTPQPTLTITTPPTVSTPVPVINPVSFTPTVSPTGSPVEDTPHPTTKVTPPTDTVSIMFISIHFSF